MKNASEQDFSCSGARTARRTTLLLRRLVFAVSVILGQELAATDDISEDWFFAHLTVTYNGNFSTPFSETNRLCREMERVAHAGRVLESYIADMLRKSDEDTSQSMRITFLGNPYGDVKDEKIGDVFVPLYGLDEALAKINRFFRAIPNVAGGAQVRDFGSLEQKHKDNYGPVLSPDGSKVVFRCWQKDQLHLFLYDCRDRKCRELARYSDLTERIAWSPDGRHVALARDAVFEVIGAESLKVEASFPLRIDHFLWLQDSGRIVAEVLDDIDWRMIWVLKIQPEISATQIAREERAGFRICALSPDGSHLIVCRGAPSSKVFVTGTSTWRLRPLNLPAGGPERFLLGPKGTYYCMAGAANEASSGEMAHAENDLRFVSENSDIYKGDVETGELKYFGAVRVRAQMAASSADGTTLLLRTDREVCALAEGGTLSDFELLAGQAFVTSLTSGCYGTYQVHPDSDGCSAPVRLLHLLAIENGKECDNLRAPCLSAFLAPESSWSVLRFQSDAWRGRGDQVVIYRSRSEASRVAKLLMARDSYVDAAISPSGEVVFVRAPDGGCYRLFDSRGDEIAPDAGISRNQW